MIGNDVVDLADPETRASALHPRFDARVFTSAERALLRASGAPERLRWILWACKEAAYKVARKLDPRTFFAPKHFEVELDASLRGTVQASGRRFPVEVHATATAVHAIARDRELAPARVLWGSRELSAAEADAAVDPGAAARSFAVRTLAAHLDAPAEDLAIERTDRVPRLRGPAGIPRVDLSLSHHGRLVAFASELLPQKAVEAGGR